MNDLSMAEAAYGSSSKSARDPGEVEYAILGRISHKLRQSALNREADFAAFARALSDNRAFWSVIASDVADSRNALPAELKARLFWLSEFVTAETARLLRREGDVEALVSVNAAVMQGLRGREGRS